MKLIKVSNKFLNDKNFFEKLRAFFLIIMLSCLFIRNIGAYLLVPPIIDSTIFSFLCISGMVIITFGILTGNILFDFKNNLFLLIFLFFIVISSIANYKYGLVGSFKDILWTSISFFLL